MKPEDIPKIQGLYQGKRWSRRNGKKVCIGLVWIGWWIEDGKQIKRWIGTELPPYLQWMIDERVKLPGRKRWSWPAYKMANK